MVKCITTGKEIPASGLAPGGGNVPTGDMFAGLPKGTMLGFFSDEYYRRLRKAKRTTKRKVKSTKTKKSTSRKSKSRKK